MANSFRLQHDTFLQASTAVRGASRPAAALSVTDFAGKFKGRPPRGATTCAHSLAVLRRLMMRPRLADTFEERCRAEYPDSTTGTCQASPTGRGDKPGGIGHEVSRLFALTWLAVATVGAVRPRPNDVRRRSGRRHAIGSLAGRSAVDSNDRVSNARTESLPAASHHRVSIVPANVPDTGDPVPMGASFAKSAWNPLGTPYWTHELRPVTRWEARPATVQVPVARTNWVEETRTTQVPVTTYRTVPEEYTQQRRRERRAPRLDNRPCGSECHCRREPTNWRSATAKRSAAIAKPLGIER